MFDDLYDYFDYLFYSFIIFYLFNLFFLFNLFDLIEYYYGKNYYCLMHCLDLKNFLMLMDELPLFYCCLMYLMCSFIINQQVWMLGHYEYLNILEIFWVNILMILESSLYGLMGLIVWSLLPLNDYLTFFYFKFILIYFNILFVILIFLYDNLFNLLIIKIIKILNLLN